jgi:hypothetical protein
MFKSSLKVLVLGASLLVVFGVSVICVYQLGVDGDAGYEVGRWAVDFTSSPGQEVGSSYSLGSNAGGVYFAIDESSYPAGTGLGSLSQTNTTHWICGPTHWRIGYPQPKWLFCGFNFETRKDAFGQKEAAVVPDWFIVSLGLLATFVLILRSGVWRRHQAARSRRCHQCGCELRGRPAKCPECGASPEPAPVPAANRIRGRWLIWWIPAIVFGLLGVPAAHLDSSGTWAVVLVSFAFVCMIVSVLLRNLPATAFTTTSPRGFEVVMKPPPNRPDGNAKPGA